MDGGREFVGVEEVAAEEGGVDVVAIGSAVLVGTVEGRIFLLPDSLVVEVDSSAGGTLGLVHGSHTSRSVHL